VCEHLFVRWQGLSVDEERDRRLPKLSADSVVRRFDAPEALGIRFHEVRARSALNRVPKQSRMPFPYTVNPYRGCSHACHFCFARPTHTYLDLNAREDFEREIIVKVNVPEVLRAELSRPSWKREHVALGTNTDPYQWVESRYRLMPGIWEAIRDSRTPSSLVTKSPLALRDLKLLQEINNVSEMTVYLSVPTLDEGAWRETEPHTPSPRARIEAVAELNRAGVPAGILVAPLMPGINDSPEEVSKILELAADAGAVSVAGVTLHLRGEVRDIFFDWLRHHRPDLIPYYEHLYSRGAYARSEKRREHSELVKYRSRRQRRGTTKQSSTPASGEPAPELTPQPSLF
jgi:DNA repair photolyase